MDINENLRNDEPGPHKVSVDSYLQVRLITKSPKFATPDVPYSLPETTSIEELNSLINQILSENIEDWDTVSFDFLIDGEVVLTSIGEFVHLHKLSTEDVVVVEYIEHLPAPEPQETFEHHDWVSAVRMSGDYILTGCYDNTVSIWSRTGDLLLTNGAHLAPIKAVSWIPKESHDSAATALLTASHDQTATLWSWDSQAPKPSLTPKAFFRGHAGSVDGLDVSPDKQKFCSVSWDKMLKVWSLAESFDDGIGSDGEPVDKKLKTDGKRLTRVPVATLSGHKEAVSTCVWTAPSEIITASWDHSIMLWDVELGGMSRQITGPKVFLSVAYSPLKKLLVTGAADRLVRMFDPRSNEGSIVKIGFSSHMGWVSSVAWSPSNENLFLSGSYDMMMKMWDIRSPRSPIYDMGGHTDKILCVAWSDSDLILSGGADNGLKIFNAVV